MAKKVFNEKKYQKTKKILNIIGISWIIGVVIISGILTVVGSRTAKELADKAKAEISNVVDTADTVDAVDTVNAEDLTAAKSLVSTPPNDVSGYTGPKTQDELTAAEAAIRSNHTIAMGQDGWYEDSVAEMREISALDSAYRDYVSDLSENESWQRSQAEDLISSANESVNELSKNASKIQEKASQLQDGMLSVFNGISNIAINGMSGASIVGVIILTVICCMPGVILLFIANSRAIYGFTAQSTVPVAKESTEQMAPAFGTAAREITKGIKSGWTGGASKKKTVKKKAKK